MSKKYNDDEYGYSDEGFEKDECEDNLDSLKIYSKEISDISLLTAEEEKELSIMIAGGDIKARNELVDHNLRLVLKVIKDFECSSISASDLIQAGNMGLLLAASRFDYRKGKFSTFAVPYIKGHILEEIQSHNHLIRLPSNAMADLRRYKKFAERITGETGEEPSIEMVAEEMGKSKEYVYKLYLYACNMISLDQPFGEDDDLTLVDTISYDDSYGDPETTVLRNDENSRLYDAIGKLSPMEKEIAEAQIESSDSLNIRELADRYGVHPKEVANCKLKLPERLRELMDCA